MRLSLSIDAGFAEALGRKGDLLQDALRKKMNVASVYLAGKIIAKLHGAVLHQRTGILAGSVRVIPASETDGLITGGVEAGGGPAWYGAVHEHGGARAYVIRAVNKRTLRFFIEGRKVFAVSVLHPALPVRSFMVSTAEEEVDFVAQTLQGGIGEAMRR